MQITIELSPFAVGQRTSPCPCRKFVNPIALGVRKLHGEQIPSGVISVSSASMTRARICASVFRVRTCELMPLPRPYRPTFRSLNSIKQALGRDLGASRAPSMMAGAMAAPAALYCYFPPNAFNWARALSAFSPLGATSR
jgi:hypothetical protein